MGPFQVSFGKIGAITAIRFFMAVAMMAGAWVLASAIPAGATQPPASTAVNCAPIAGTGDTCPNPPTQPGGLDHFLCYKAVTDGFTPPLVDLQDQFGNHTLVQPLSASNSAGSDNQLCTPVIKTIENTQGTVVGPEYTVGNPEAHLYCFTDNTFSANGTQVTVTNQFGTGLLTVGTSTRLCLPSWKYDPNQIPTNPLASGSVATSSWTDPANLNLNHFHCYDVSPTTASNPGFSNTPPSVQLEDQFGTYTPVTIGAPQELCAPVIKQVVNAAGQPVGNPSAINSDGLTGAHLLCFAVDVGGTHNVLVGNQFSATPTSAVPSPVSVGVSFADMLCLPSFKTVNTPGTPEVPNALLLPLAGVAVGGLGVFVHRRRRMGTARAVNPQI